MGRHSTILSFLCASSPSHLALNFLPRFHRMCTRRIIANSRLTSLAQIQSQFQPEIDRNNTWNFAGWIAWRRHRLSRFRTVPVWAREIRRHSGNDPHRNGSRLRWGAKLQHRVLQNGQVIKEYGNFRGEFRLMLSQSQLSDSMVAKNCWQRNLITTLKLTDGAYFQTIPFFVK